MTPILRHPLTALALGGIGLLAVFERPLAAHRPIEPELRAAVELVVVSPRDAGPGSLREAIFAADRAGQRARIRLRTDRIVLESPLPPLLNPDGVVLDATGMDGEIDARRVVDGPVLDVAAPRCVLRGVRLRGASGPAILVRASQAHLDRVFVAESETAVSLVEDVREIVVEESTFEQNSIGIRLAPGSTGIRIRDNRFRKHDEAAVWAVAPEPPLGGADPAIVLQRNRFEDDRIGVVLINRPSLVEDNHVARAAEAGLFVTGPVWIRRNRLRDGLRVGLFVDAPDRAVIEDNEVDRNAAVGILLRRGHAAELRRNRVYTNGYGIAVVFDERGQPNVVADNLVLGQRHDGLYVVGAAPLLRGNRLQGNQDAGLRILDYVPWRGARLAAGPLLQDNVLRGNGTDAPARGEYREPPPREK